MNIKRVPCLKASMVWGNRLITAGYLIGSFVQLHAQVNNPQIVQAHTQLDTILGCELGPVSFNCENVYNACLTFMQQENLKMLTEPVSILMTTTSPDLAFQAAQNLFDLFGLNGNNADSYSSLLDSIRNALIQTQWLCRTTIDIPGVTGVIVPVSQLPEMFQHTDWGHESFKSLTPQAPSKPFQLSEDARMRLQRGLALAQYKK